MIDQLFLLTLSLFCIAYAILHRYLWNGINRLNNPHSSSPKHNISIIIAAHNEEKNILPLLISLQKLNYPSDKFEIIIVNDRSTDSTSSLVETFQNRIPNLRFISIDSNTSDMPHKKNALNTGILQSRFDILAFTDADCTVPPEWLNEISNHFSPEVGFVAGFSPYQQGKAGYFLRYEEYKNSLIAAAAVEQQNAFMCTGRNIAYRKEIFQHVGGFEKIKHSISGDDDLFLQVVQSETSWKIRYMISQESFIGTAPPESFFQFLQQRTRHVSASKHYPFKVQLMYSIVHLFHAMIAIGLFISPFPAFVALLVKFNIDGAFVSKGFTHFQFNSSIVNFFVNESLLVLYSFFIAPLGFLKKFTWKGSVSS